MLFWRWIGVKTTCQQRKYGWKKTKYLFFIRNRNDEPFYAGLRRSLSGMDENFSLTTSVCVENVVFGEES